jgi:hypothetical protein
MGPMDKRLRAIAKTAPNSTTQSPISRIISRRKELPPVSRQFPHSLQIVERIRALSGGR